jgi:hypothetical protein
VVVESPCLPDRNGVRYRPVVGFPGYCVGDDGSVWSFLIRNNGDRAPSWMRLKPAIERGYYRAGLRRGGKLCNRFVHCLVLEAFVGPKPAGLQGCHAPDPDSSNNALSNLRWGTPTENAADALELGRYRRGESHPSSRLTEAAVIDIHAMNAAGASLKEMADKHHVTKRNIASILKGKTWAHVRVDLFAGASG